MGMLKTDAQSLIAVLMCTYNGAVFLDAQIHSIIDQDYKSSCIWVSDDGSSDQTQEILKKYQKILGDERLVILSGPRQGFAQNFMSLVLNPAIKADYFAFADQDDIWKSDKLSRAISFLGEVETSQPALYCSCAELIDEQGRSIGATPFLPKKPSFANALIQNIAGGNTMVFNLAARRLLMQVSMGMLFPSHDWWAYQIISGVGGDIFYDKYPSIKYRQHSANEIGAHHGLLGIVRRIAFLFKGRYHQANEKNLAALVTVQSYFTTENKLIFDRFSYARKQSLLPRVFFILKSGVYRQTLFDTLGFFVAIILNKV